MLILPNICNNIVKYGIKNILKYFSKDLKKPVVFTELMNQHTRNIDFRAIYSFSLKGWKKEHNQYLDKDTNKALDRI